MRGSYDNLRQISRPGRARTSSRPVLAFCGMRWQPWPAGEWNGSVDYQRWWAARAGVAGFGQEICDAWAAEYSVWAELDPADLIVVDPGNGFSYLFDLAGTLRGECCSRAPRVVGVWGLSQPSAKERDHSRMRGHPRPGRSADDRGHLISCAAGGGYDINLVPMDAALNRGWSAEGSRFRALERRAAAAPGTLFFIRLVYQDGTDRPSRFEAGVQDEENLLVDTFQTVPDRPSRCAARHCGSRRRSASIPPSSRTALTLPPLGTACSPGDGGPGQRA